MRFNVSVPGYIDIGTFDTLRDLREGLADSGCKKRFTLDEYETMVQSLIWFDIWSRKMSSDPGRFFFIKVVEEECE